MSSLSFWLSRACNGLFGPAIAETERTSRRDIDYSIGVLVGSEGVPIRHARPRSRSLLLRAQRWNRKCNGGWSIAGHKPYTLALWLVYKHGEIQILTIASGKYSVPGI